MEILITSWPEAKKAAFSIRQAVFVHEQGIPEELEIDEFDPSAQHALALLKGQHVATARLVDLGDKQSQIGRMAVLSQFRGCGIGTTLLNALIDSAKHQGVTSLILHSQLLAMPFYEKLGFSPEGDIYEEAGMPHRNMILNI